MLGPRATEPIVVVAVIRVVVVTIGRPRVPRIIVEGTAAGCDQPPSIDSFLNTNSGKIKFLKRCVFACLAWPIHD